MTIQKLNHQLLPEKSTTQLGLIVLQSDVTIEDEFRYYFHDSNISLLCNRIPFENEVNADTLKQMEGHLQRTMSLYPPDTRFDALGYACTSGALHIGSGRIAELVGKERDCATVSDPMQASMAALAHLGATRIAYLAPYSIEVSSAMIEQFRSNGIEVVTAATFDESQDKYVGRISPDCIAKEAIELCSGSVRNNIDAVFIACTNMKAASVIPRIEEALDIPALSSNLVLAWHLATCAGLQINGAGKGRLLN